MSRLYTVLLLFSLIFFTNEKIALSSLEFNTENWRFASDNGVYYQLQLYIAQKYQVRLINQWEYMSQKNI